MCDDCEYCCSECPQRDEEFPASFGGVTFPVDGPGAGKSWPAFIFSAARGVGVKSLDLSKCKPEDVRGLPGA